MENTTYFVSDGVRLCRAIAHQYSPVESNIPPDSPPAKAHIMRASL